MENDKILAFENILSRIYSKENEEKYNLLATGICNEDEARIWELCEKFWFHPDSSYRTYNGKDYKLNHNLDNNMAKRYINELTQLLDKLGWY